MKGFTWGLNGKKLEIYQGAVKVATISNSKIGIDEQIQIAKLFSASTQMYWALCSCLVELDKFGIVAGDPIFDEISEALESAENKVLAQRKAPKAKKAA